MKITLRLIKILLILLGSAAVFIPLTLYRPDLFPFQPSFGSNVVPVAMMVTAWTTLFLAYAAFRTIENSNEQEKRRREEDLLKETWERKERLLNEIIEWTVELSSEELKLNPKMMKAKGQLITKYRLTFWSDIEKAIGALMAKLDEYIEILETVGKHHEQIAGELRELATKVIEEAAKIKTRDIT